MITKKLIANILLEKLKTYKKFRDVTLMSLSVMTPKNPYCMF